MNKVLIGYGMLEKAMKRFLRIRQANMVPFDRIPGQPNSHFAIAELGVEMPSKMYTKVEIFMYEGCKYQVFLKSGFVIENR